MSTRTIQHRPRKAKKAYVGFMTYLKFHRYRLKLTQAQLAKKAGISQGLYCEYEKGLKRPLPHHHGKLADALERPLDEFTAKLHNVNVADMVIAATATSK